VYYARVAYRLYYLPDIEVNLFGYRCARGL
jgi:hypothetical protein